MAAERNVDVRVRLKGADQFARGMKGVNANLGTMGKWLDVTKGILGANFISQGLSAIVDKLGDAVDASIDFESALTGVAKTTDFSDVGLKNFGNELMKLSERIPVSASELAGLAEAAGQLGIAEGDIIEFTEVVAAMGVSTNISAEEAATAFARIANIFGTSSKDYSKLGSAIVDLGNNFATTESEIVDMAKNMAGMGALVGMTEADVFAFATALSSIGIEAQAGGSAMQKLFQNFEMAVNGKEAELAIIASTAGVTASAFSQMWESDPAGAIERFLTGLGKVDDAGGSALITLENLDIREVRLIRSVLGLASAEGLLKSALDTSNNAWEENYALAEEAGKRYETTASRMQMAQNAIDNASVTLGDSISDTALAGKELIGDMASEWNEKAREINLEKEVKKASEEYEAQKKIIDENTQIAKELASVIASMGSPENLDAEGQKEYVAQMLALTTIVPELNKLWDEETMTIKGGTTAIYENINAAQKLATAEAELNKNRNTADAYNIIEEALEAKRAELALAAAELTAAQKEYDAYWEQARNSGKTDFEIETGSTEYLQRLSIATENVNKLQSEISKSEAELEEYSYVVEDFEASAGDYVTAMNGMADATSGMNESQMNASTMLDVLGTELDEAIGKFETAKETILETLDGMGKFTKIEMPEIEKPETQIEGMESQIEFIEAYSAALKKAQEMGLDSGILETLSDGTQEDYATLASIVSGTEEDVATINAKYAELSAAKDALATELATAQTGLQTTVESVVTMANSVVDGVDVGSEMYAKGAANVQNLIDGINSKIAGLTIAVARVKSLNSQLTSASNPDGSHAAGLSFVPHDNYIAQLHRGEMVLTALEAKAYRAEQFINYARPATVSGATHNDGRVYNQTYNDTVRFGNVFVREEEDIEKISKKLSRHNKKKARGQGYT